MSVSKGSKKKFCKGPVDNADYDEMVAERSVVVMCLHLNDDHVFTDRCVGTIASNVFTVQ